MAKLNLRAVEERTSKLGSRAEYDREFLFDLLEAYGRAKSSITRLRSGNLDVAQDPSREVAQKNVVYFHESELGQAFDDLVRLSTAAHVTRYTPRFVIATDYSELVALDMKTQENLKTPIGQIDQHFTFFLPWAGMEKVQYVSDSHADVRAAEKMGKLFDELLEANPNLADGKVGVHSLNVFFTRLLFCFFAEDTGIFAPDVFTTAIGSQTQSDGSDMRDFLIAVFHALDTAKADDKPANLRDFPYVNGRLFSETADISVPKFTGKARQHLIELGTLNWKEINPDIFGSMFQAVVTPGQRSDMGQHYTSVPNILKTIEPLFLDELKDEFDASFDSVPRLNRLYDRIAQIKVFDPACGSGNFLVIAYKELRRLEHSILERLAQLDTIKFNSLWADSRINIENFYGIEIDDFAVEIAILSMWIAKHQMNTEFKGKFGMEIPLIPLKETGRIQSGNAARIDWNLVCPNDGFEEIYLIGNPPYGGSKKLKKEQKDDYPFVFGDRPYSKNLDYIALWFIKGSDYIGGTQARLAFVSTNSVVQGEHVALMFPMIYEMGLEIGYAYTSFKWENNAKANAGVSVVVISLRNAMKSPKYLVADGIKLPASNINGYLADAEDVFLKTRRKTLSPLLPMMSFGSMPNPTAPFVLSAPEKHHLVSAFPEAADFVRPFLGADEFISGEERFTLWIEESEVPKAMDVQPISERIASVERLRKDSSRKATQKLAAVPWRFGEIRYKPTDSIIVPSVSSERREYIPIGYLGPDTVISNLAFAVYDAEPWLFALLTSKMHMAWVRAVGGKMETRYRYSNTIVYNNFPVPELSARAKNELTQRALRVLDVREYHSEFTLAELYDPDKMPDQLRRAHAQVDAAVDKLYSAHPFESDEARLSVLFAMYKEAIEAEEAAGAKGKRKK
ncbi:class I SAM-dependent DNA methyltransferase [Corynebacterium guaraldiae]|uniref:DNA methyltransferase n=1 Tax=Corynebacterium guaraldiae TaxID=3051103 RepID=UPI001177C587|nr:DNA methyltransferase [Corynebacterium guaraldiae]MCG7260546.1 N-6 DNA methylase [Corynebacterium aurimucosum]TRX31864.1 class I SAM-dependent DNA methyltransferase [Corynebacterium guaraldiae]TRX38389.1 class I SAM-dependent DNA methyltransferase [Corynebacterium guaraldiae]